MEVRRPVARPLGEECNLIFVIIVYCSTVLGLLCYVVVKSQSVSSFISIIIYMNEQEQWPDLINWHSSLSHDGKYYPPQTPPSDKQRI